MAVVPTFDHCCRLACGRGPPGDPGDCVLPPSLPLLQTTPSTPAVIQCDDGRQRGAEVQVSGQVCTRAVLQRCACSGWRGSRGGGVGCALAIGGGVQQRVLDRKGTGEAARVSAEPNDTTMHCPLPRLSSNSPARVSLEVFGCKFRELKDPQDRMSVGGTVGGRRPHACGKRHRAGAAGRSLL